MCAAHSEYMTSVNAAPQWSLPDATQIFFFKMAHDKVFGIRCNKTSIGFTNHVVAKRTFSLFFLFLYDIFCLV